MSGNSDTEEIDRLTNYLAETYPEELMMPGESAVTRAIRKLEEVRTDNKRLRYWMRFALDASMKIERIIQQIPNRFWRRFDLFVVRNELGAIQITLDGTLSDDPRSFRDIYPGFE